MSKLYSIRRLAFFKYLSSAFVLSFRRSFPSIICTKAWMPYEDEELRTIMTGALLMVYKFHSSQSQSLILMSMLYVICIDTWKDEPYPTLI